MKLSYHGGVCCGIKHIYDMGMSPNTVHSSLVSLEDVGKEYFLDASSLTYSQSGGKHMFQEAAPKENGIKRIERYLDYLRKYRPNGIVEVVLNEEQLNTPNGWDEVLRCKYGFNLVNSCLNSNSELRIYVYHLNIGE